MSGDALVNEHIVAEHHANVDMSVFDLSKKVCSYLSTTQILTVYQEHWGYHV